MSSSETKPLADHTVEELRRLAADLNIVGRSSMPKEALVAAVELVQRAQATPEQPPEEAKVTPEQPTADAFAQPADPAEPVGGAGAAAGLTDTDAENLADALNDDEEPEEDQELDPEDLARIHGASTSALERILNDPELTAVQARAVRAELDTRSGPPQPQPAPEPVEQQYEVIRGGTVYREGMLTDLAAGSVVSARTHDLGALRQHGIELRPCKGLAIEESQLGLRRSVARV